MKTRNTIKPLPKTLHIGKREEQQKHKFAHTWKIVFFLLFRPVLFPFPGSSQDFAPT